MVYEDTVLLKTLPNFKKYLAGGAEIKRVRSIYPSITYPAHVTIATGAWPDHHGVVSNNEFHPGVLKLPWNWFHSVVKIRDIFDAAKEAGLSTAGIFWPVTGNHPSIDNNIAEYWPQMEGETFRDTYSRVGSNPSMLKIMEKNFRKGIVARQHPDYDDFIIDCACDVIRECKPDLLMIHPANIDDYRHKYGSFSEKINQGIKEIDDYIGRIMRAAEEAGTCADTSLFLISDHGQIDITRIVNINVALADYGLIRTGDKGQILEWDTYSLSNAMSALVYLREPDNVQLYNKTYALLRYLCAEGIYGISRVFTEPEARASERLGGDFSFVLETDGYTSFGEDWKRPIVQNFDLSDYRFGRATHGYLPGKGPQPILMARGRGIREGAVLEKRNIVDLAPTFAKLLGLTLPDADGVCISEILE